MFEGRKRMRIFQEEIFVRCWLGDVLLRLRRGDLDRQRHAPGTASAPACGARRRRGRLPLNRDIQAGGWTNTYHDYLPSARGVRRLAVRHRAREPPGDVEPTSRPRTVGLRAVRASFWPMDTIPPERGRPSAVDITSWVRAHGGLMIHQSGGCCDDRRDGYPVGEYRGQRGVGRRDRLPDCRRCAWINGDQFPEARS